MNLTIFFLFVVFLGLRLWSLKISMKHERRLKANGATEYGCLNTKVLAGLHVAYYIAALVEGLIRGVQFDWVTWIGLAMMIFSMGALFYVIYALSPFWTVKLIIARDHRVVSSPLFQRIRHPNYVLNILPELIGLTLLLKSYAVFWTLFPLYLTSLGVRVYQEEKIMRATFKEY